MSDFINIEGETIEETRRRWIAYENRRHAEAVALGCSVCGKFNLDEYLCPTCKGSRECVNCCGCYELEGEGEK